MRDIVWKGLRIQPHFLYPLQSEITSLFSPYVYMFNRSIPKQPHKLCSNNFLFLWTGYSFLFLIILSKMPINFIIGVSDYKISSCDYIIAGTNYIITTTDYRINRHFDVFYAYVDKFSCSEETSYLILYNSSDRIAIKWIWCGYLDSTMVVSTKTLYGYACTEGKKREIASI